MDDNKSPIRTFDPGVVQTPIGFYRTLFRLHDAKKQHCLPAIVKSYDREKGIVEVIPLAKLVLQTEDGEEVKNRPTYTVPVYKVSQGGFSIDVPLFIGDTGWLFAGDRNTDTAREKNSSQIKEDESVDDDGKFDGENEGAQRPDTLALGDFAWGFFLPASWSQTALSNDDGIVITYTPKPNETEAKPINIKVNKDGIKIVRGVEGENEDGDTIIIDKDGLRYEGKEDRKIEVITQLRYDLQSHQIQKKTVEQKVRGNFVVGVGKESDWTMIDGGQAVPEQTSSEA